MMATLIRRAEALKRMNILEEKAMAAKDRAGAEMIVKCWNAIMSCKVEERVFCTRCGKVIRTEQIPEEDQPGGVIKPGILPGQMTVEDYL